jgi:hypothetical protein
MLDWLQGGVRLAWLLDPATETAHIYRAGNPQPETLSGFHHTLLGERVLPGFRFELQRLRG